MAVARADTGFGVQRKGPTGSYSNPITLQNNPNLLHYKNANGGIDSRDPEQEAYNKAQGRIATEHNPNMMRERDRLALQAQFREQAAGNQFNREKEFSHIQNQRAEHNANLAHNKAVDMLQRQMGYKDKFMDKEFGLLQGDKDNDYTRQANAERRRMDMFSPYFDKFGFGGNGSSSTGYESPEGLPATIDMGEITGYEDAARNAAIARAKDTAGMNARAAMTGLSDSAAARGVGQGSGLAMAAAGNITNDAAGQVGEVNRDQLMQALDAARLRASEAYSGAITQRGQDINAGMTMRGQNMSMLNPLLGLITARY